VELRCFRPKDDVEPDDGLASSLIVSPSSNGGYAPCQTNSRSMVSGDQDEKPGRSSSSSWSQVLPSCCRGNTGEPSRPTAMVLGGGRGRWEKIILAGLLALVVCFTGSTSFYYRRIHAALRQDQSGYDVEIISGRTSDRGIRTLARLNHEVDTLCDRATYASCYIQTYQYTCNCRMGTDYTEQWSWKVTMPKAKPNNQLYRMVWYDDSADGTHHRMGWKKALAFKETQSR
jgi:hypothetical protein